MKCRVLTTGQPGKSCFKFVFTIYPSLGLSTKHAEMFCVYMTLLLNFPEDSPAKNLSATMPTVFTITEASTYKLIFTEWQCEALHVLFQKSQAF